MLIKHGRVVLAIAMLLATTPCLALSQTVTGEIEGWVVGEDGIVLNGAQVTARGPGVRERSVITDARGYFRFLALPPGRYDVEVNYIGRQPVRVSNRPVHLGSTTTIGRIVAHAQPIQLSAVTAEAQRERLDASTAVVGAVMGREEFEQLPIERDFQSIPALLPHVSNSVYGDGINFAGATGLENQFYVDGANITDPLNGAGALRLPYNFIKEIEVRTGGYEAEYRGALGGVVNVVTASGTNELKAEVFAFYAGNQFSDEPRLNIRANTRGDYALYDFGGSLAGPMLRDRLWFFASWNPAFETEDVPLPSLGMFRDHKVSHRYAAKLTWQPRAATRIELNAIGDPSSRDAVGSTIYGYGATPTVMPKPDPLLSERITGTTTFAARLTHLLNPSLLLEASADNSDWYDIARRRPGGSDALNFVDRVSVPGEVIWDGGYPENRDMNIGHKSAALRLTALRGRHTWKAGADLQRIHAGGRDDSEGVGYSPTDTTPVWGWGWWKQNEDPVVNRSLGLFVQDSWAISDSLRFNFGLRWGSQRIYGSDGLLSANVNGEWQPRVGLVYQPGSAARYKIAGSYGRYYQQIPAFSMFNAYTFGLDAAGYDFDHDPRIDPEGGIETWSYRPTRESTGVLELKGLSYDEFSVGYERLLGDNAKAGARVVRRILRNALEDGSKDGNEWHFGNPGFGRLDFLPRANRTYTALELSYERSLKERAFVTASYVLSRSHGNYTGFFSSDFNYPFANYNSSFDLAEMLSNGTGLLPNDRTHVLKASGWYRMTVIRLTLGTSLLVQSGTPRSEFGGTRVGAPFFGFVAKRGTSGRTPAVADLNLRAAYRLPRLVAKQASLLLDVFHVASRKAPLLYEQQHYFALDESGRQTDENDDYGRVIARQAPMSVRLGVQAAF